MAAKKFDSNSFYKILCKLGPLFRSLNTTVSIFTLIVLSIDRSYVIIYPLRRKLSYKQSIFMIIIIWILGTLIGTYSYFSYDFYKLDLDDKNLIESSVCQFVDNMPITVYLSTLIFFQYICPIIVFAITFFILFKNNKKFQNEMIRNNAQTSFRNVTNGTEESNNPLNNPILRNRKKV